jgi:methionyl aminopeptidase
MDNNILEKYLKAGQIAGKARELGASLVVAGMKVEEIADRVEAEIFKLGGDPAFPVNISLNNIAAHYTPTLGDPLEVGENDHVKIDVGVHIDGYIGDTAVTVKPSGKDELIECSEKMLKVAIPLFTHKRRIIEISEAIKGVAKEFGFNPVRNLTGHGLEQWNVHAVPSIPNVPVSENSPLRGLVLSEGQVVACEPFCTTGRGMVRDVDPAVIFKWVRDVPVRGETSRSVLNLAKNKWKGLPFAKRWVQKELGNLKTQIALSDLVKRGGLHAYKILRDDAPVAQTEHTIIVGETPVVTTKV